MSVVWTGNAAAVKQIDKVTVSGAFAAAETGTLIINGKSLVITVGASDTDLADVATAIRDAFNATSRLTGLNSNTDATSNFGGQEFGEFTGIEAVIYIAEPTIVYFLAKATGRPELPYWNFTLTVSDTAASGALARAAVVAHTGPNNWDNAKNWAGGVVPASDDAVIFQDSAVPCLFGLPNGSLEVTLNVYMSFTGTIGLPVINTSNPAKPYYEYRQRYVRLDDAGSGTNIAHRFGLGVGTGSPLINVKHSTLKCTPVVYGTGTPQISGAKALNLILTASTSELTILKGSVDCGAQDSSTGAIVVLNIGYTDSQPSDCNVVCVNGLKDDGGISGATFVNMSGGAFLVGGAAGINTLKLLGGVVRIEDQTDTVYYMICYGGKIIHASTCTSEIIQIDNGGELDCNQDLRQFTVGTSVQIGKNSTLRDRYNRINGTVITSGPFSSLTLDLIFSGVSITY